jgi:hypothetical protein
VHQENILGLVKDKYDEISKDYSDSEDVINSLKDRIIEIIQFTSRLLVENYDIKLIKNEFASNDDILEYLDYLEMIYNALVVNNLIYLEKYFKEKLSEDYTNFVEICKTTSELE